MLRTIAVCAGVWLTAVSAFAQAQGDIPAPERVDPQGVQAWFARYIETDGWTLIGADSDGLALGASAGASPMGEGMLLANVRHEYYAPRTVGGHNVRSLQQMRLIDCRRRLNRVVSMTVFERSNLQGAGVRRETPDAEWSAPSPGSLYLAALEQMCASAAPSAGGN
ncbi:MAG: surface-adhesin E family protein [Vitreimonas sp.]